MDLNIRILSAVEGCVLVRSLSDIPFFLKGLMMYMGAVALLADLSCVSERDNFSSADAKPSGYLV